MQAAVPVHEIGPHEGYDIDSDGYDSQEELEDLAPAEYNQLVEEAENGFTEDEVKAMMTDLKEKGLVTFLREYLKPNDKGERATLRKLLLGLGAVPPASLRRAATPDLALLPFTRLILARILRRRFKLPQYNTVDDAVRLLGDARNIIVLSGAGISTSCGIPDFRSADGLYAQLQAEGKYDLDDPTQMFDIAYFRECPSVFYSFAKQIYPSNFTPSACHRWVKMLEDKGTVSPQLLRNYTQNIDTLESQAGVTKVLQCHGSFKTASCLRCKRRVAGSDIEPYIMSQTVATCDVCKQAQQEELARIAAITEARRKAKGKGRAPGWGSGSDSDEEADGWGGGEPGIMKPDITFFGQALDSQFDECLWRDREQVDLLIIIGTSLKVAPVSEVLAHIPHSVPQIFINLTPVTHVQPDICLHGDADTIVTYLSDRLGWTIPPPSGTTPRADTKAREKVEWQSGVGAMSHMHFLQDNERDGSSDEEKSVASVEAGIEHVHMSASSSEQKIDIVEPHDDDGDEEDEDDEDDFTRPAKRIKA